MGYGIIVAYYKYHVKWDKYVNHMMLMQDKRRNEMKQTGRTQWEQVIRVSLPAFILLLGALFFILPTQAQAYEFETVDFPYATETKVYDINNSGQIVGYFYEGSDWQGFTSVYNDDTETWDHTVLYVPDAMDLEPRGINDSGHITGRHQDGDGVRHGFVYDGATYTPLDMEGAGFAGTYPQDINNSGDVAGSYGAHGFIAENTGSAYSYTPIDLPGTSTTYVDGINDSKNIVGRTSGGSYPSYIGIYNGGTYTYAEIAMSEFNTYVYSINDSDEIAGYYSASMWTYHGFIAINNGSAYDYTQLDVDIPGVNVTRTYIRGISNSGNIAGFYQGDGGINHGFVAYAEEGDPTWKGEEEPELIPDGNSNTRYASTAIDPINTFTGGLFSRKTADLNLGGPMTLYFQRYYDSYLKRSNITGDLGSNWRHNFDAHLYWVDDSITYVTSDGRVTDFLKDPGTGDWDQLTNTDTPYQLYAEAGQDVAVYDTEDDRIFTFDFTTGGVITGKLVQIEDGHGNVHIVTYDLGTGQIQTVSDGLGRTLTFTYNSDATPKISAVSDGTRNVSFQYTDPVDTEYLTLVTDALLGVTEYNYKDTSAEIDHALMTGMIRPEGNVPYTQTFYGLADPLVSGRVATQTDSGSNTFSLDYSGLDTTLTNPLGHTRVHTHTATGEFSNRQDQEGESFSMGSDATGRRNSLTDRLGDTTSLGYDAPSGNISSVTNADGTTKSYSYTAQSLGDLTFFDITMITHADTTTESFSYDANGNLTSHTDQIGNTVSATHNANGQVLTSTNTAGGVTTNTYNPDATLATTEDPGGNKITLGYDALRRLNLYTFDDSNTRQFIYDAKDHLLSSIDENTRATTFSYDANGNLSTIVDSLSNTTTFAYDGNDRVLSVTDPLGGIAGITYDALGRLETTTDENNHTTTYGYDILGRLTTVTFPGGNSASFTYDAEAVITSASDGLGNTTTFTSDQMGRITQVNSPMGNISQLGYDTMGRIISTTDQLSRATAYNRDNRGLLSGIDLPGGVISTTYARNSLGNITQVADPNGHNWQSSFNNQGLRTSRTDPLSNLQTMTYDNRNRPDTLTYADGTVRTLGYDPAGNLLSSSYSGGGPVFNYTYDANNRLLSANDGPGTPDTLTQSNDALGRISNSNGIAISRDAGGRIIGMTLAAGKTVAYAYDANSNLISVTDWTGAVTSFSFDDTDRLTGITRPAANGVDTTYAYDNDSHMVGVDEDRGATVVSSIALTRDAGGQITQSTRNTPQSSSSGPSSTIAHSFDAASQIAAAGFVYDARGHLTDDGTRTYEWDAASRLLSLMEGAVTTTYTYDAMRQRLSRSSDGVTRRYVWNTALVLNSISIERDGIGTDLRYFIHTPAGALLYSIDAVSNAHQFYHFDEMGNTVAVTDDSGAVIAGYAYTPYGKLTASTGALDNPFTWQGRYGVMDEGNYLYYVRARYYNADTGRFISRDPIKAIGPKEVNPYQYALANPLRFVDVTGWRSVCEAEIALTEAKDYLAAVIKWKGLSFQNFHEQDDLDEGSFELLKIWYYQVNMANSAFSKAKTRVARAEDALATYRRGMVQFASLFTGNDASLSTLSEREAHLLHLKENLEEAEKALRKAKEAFEKDPTERNQAFFHAIQDAVTRALEALEAFAGDKKIPSVVPELGGIVVLC